MLGNICGRALASLGRTSEAAEAFELAISEAHQYGFFMLEAFCLRDLKRLVLDNHQIADSSMHGARRLGAVLRRLIGPVDQLTSLMDGLNVSELLALPAPDSSNAVQETEAATLRTELQGLRLKGLRDRAKQMGVDEDTLEDALDEEDSSAAVIALILAATEAAAHAATDVAAQDTVLRAELEGLRLKALRQRARDAGVDSDVLEDVTDSDDPKGALIELLIAKIKQEVNVAGRDASLRKELQGLRLKELRTRGRDAGISPERLEDATDSDDPKAAVIELLLAQPDSSEAAKDRPHFGDGKPKSKRDRESATSSNTLLPAGKHAMLSYQWDDQQKVIAARKSLAKLGVSTWMDIDGGMQQD
eukprot:COSAG06_NODE_12358_length_1391_cov_1.183437_1_plen_360_part_10